MKKNEMLPEEMAGGQKRKICEYRKRGDSENPNSKKIRRRLYKRQVWWNGPYKRKRNKLFNIRTCGDMEFQRNVQFRWKHGIWQSRKETFHWYTIQRQGNWKNTECGHSIHNLWQKPCESRISDKNCIRGM